MKWSVRLAVIAVAVAMVGTVAIPMVTNTETKYQDCSDLLRENAKLKDDLSLLKKEYLKEKDNFGFFRSHMWNQIDLHNARCTHGKIGLISN